MTPGPLDQPLDRRELLTYAGLGTGRAHPRRRAGRPGAGGAAQAPQPGSPSRAAAPSRRAWRPGGRTPRGISLWTRLDGATKDRKIRLEVARDRDFRRIVKRRTLVLRGKYDHTVEARLAGKYLKPGEEYFYRFETRSTESQIGRFKTALPGNSRQPVKIVFFSCQDWQAGYYGAHSAIAREDADLVVCLGDYIYERNFYDGPAQGHARREQGRRGADARRVPQQVPDVQDRPGPARHARIRAVRRHLGRPRGGGQLRGRPAGRGDAEGAGAVRRAAGQRATAPSTSSCRSSPTPASPSWAATSTAGCGSARNVELFLLDERQYRDDQPCGDSFFTPCDEAESDAAQVPRRPPARLAEAPAARVGRHVEADRQPADGDGARHRPGRADQQGLVGRLRPGATRPAGAHPGLRHPERVLPHRRHPHLLRRRRRGRRPRARERGHRVRGRVDHLAGSARDAAGRDRCAPHQRAVPADLQQPPGHEPAPEVPGAVEPRLRRRRGVTERDEGDLQGRRLEAPHLRDPHDRAVPRRSWATRTCRSSSGPRARGPRTRPSRSRARSPRRSRPPTSPSRAAGAPGSA